MSTPFDRSGNSNRRDTLAVEQFPNGPLSKGGVHEKVARRRYQKPTPQRRGKHWTILVREDVIVDGRSQRKPRRVTLGPAKLSKAEAERLRDHHLAALNHPQVGIGGACLFRDFVLIYERDVLPTLASTTQERTRSVLKNHLVPEFGDFMLRELTLEKLQGYYMRLQGSKLSAESIDKVRDVHSAVMRTAVDLGRLDANPLEKIRLKRRRLNRAKPFSRVDQFILLVEAMAEPYASMVYVAGFTGLRFSELAGLQWRNIGDGSISIDQRYARGDWDEPKSHASRATIPVDQHVLDRIHHLKTIEVVIQAGWAERRYPAVKSSGPDDLVFQSVKDGSPMRDNNVLSKHIKPAARALGFDWVNWQVLRRSCATWLQQAGVDVKDAQGLLRHSRASTTQDIYQQIVAESQHRAVRKLTTFAQQGRSVQ